MAAKILAISGHAGSGKDTVGQMFYNQLEADGYSTLLIHYGDLVKFIAATCFEWDGIKDEKGRSLLQHIGTDVVREMDSNYWVDFLISICKFFPQCWDYLVIPDFRYPNELTRFQEEGFETVHIHYDRDRESFCDGLTSAQREHSSENSLKDYKADFIINGNQSLGRVRDDVTDVVMQIVGWRGIPADKLGLVNEFPSNAF